LGKKGYVVVVVVVVKISILAAQMRGVTSQLH